MCGICGLWLREEYASPQTLIEMRDSIAHRGPDGASGALLSSHELAPVRFGERPPSQEAFASHDLGFGHRRLAIIDRAGGYQPMASADEKIWLVYNGEIYNYRELRQQLRDLGHEFHTQSDTEVLLRAYQEYGTDCLGHLNGIYAFAVWDGWRRRLFLARDPFGVKPLYYAQMARGFVFGSEVKAILASGLVSPSLDLDALGLSLTFRYTPSPATIFRHVQRIPPGAWLAVEEGRVTGPHFFSQAVSPEARGQTRDWAERLASGIEQAVHRQMVSDVPIGLSLSSGVDSATLLAVMSKWSSEPVRTFTIGFRGSGRGSEVPPARRLARRQAASFQAREVGDDDYTAMMSRYMWHLEEPVGNESAPAYLFVAEMARHAGVKVLLTGQGADELFAGYDRHAGVALAHLLRPAQARWARSLLAHAARGRPIGEKYQRFLASASSPELNRRLLGAYAAFSADQLNALLIDEVREAIDWERPLGHVDEWLARAPGGTALEQMLWVDARTILADNLLLAEDKMSMAASVEVRVPLLDLELSRLAESVPGALKLRFGQRKHVYRRACAKWIGPLASRRRQIGFANPMTDWFRGPYQQSLLVRLDEPGSFLATYTRPERVREMVREHAAGRSDHTRKLFFLASLDAWHQTFCRG